MILDKVLYKNYKIRWIKDEEIRKLKDINEKVFMETIIGKILVLMNYFVIRKLVNTTGEEFLPNYNSEGPKYIVLLTWVVFAIIVAISVFQIVLKSRIYKDDDIKTYERNFYRVKLFDKFMKLLIIAIFYITLYQGFFQFTMFGVDIKETILWWIVILNILVFIYLGISVFKNYLIMETLNLTLDKTIESLESGNFDDVYKILNENKNRYALLNGIEFNIMNRAINELISTSQVVENYEAISNIKKVELITNVSHDLRTPLTSIINYVDFLSKGKFTESNKNDYIDILERKAKRIKILINDLKESIMANSNGIILDIKEIDIKEVLNQALIEVNDKINESKLKFTFKIFSEGKEVENTEAFKAFIYADYNKTLRIYQNIISNILKYSLMDSEVFIILEYDNRKINKISNMTFINETKEKIIFNESELIERFKRGDESRNTEGTGLGLDIAKSLTEAQNGEFKIEIRDKKFIVNVSI